MIERRDIIPLRIDRCEIFRCRKIVRTRDIAIPNIQTSFTTRTIGDKIEHLTFGLRIISDMWLGCSISGHIDRFRQFLSQAIFAIDDIPVINITTDILAIDIITDGIIDTISGRCKGRMGGMKIFIIDQRIYFTGSVIGTDQNFSVGFFR